MYSIINLVGNPLTELVNFHALFRGTCPEADDVSSQKFGLFLQSPVRTLSTYHIYYVDITVPDLPEICYTYVQNTSVCAASADCSLSSLLSTFLEFSHFVDSNFTVYSLSCDSN
jgi:hypothetical protein